MTPFGKYEFNKVPFGLAQAPTYFQELIQKVIGNVLYAMGYLDDIIIFSNSDEEYLQHITDIFKKLCCAFFQQELIFKTSSIGGRGTTTT